MCLFAIASLPLGSQIQIEFLPPRCLERVRVCGTVRHRAVYLYGIEFLVDSDQRPDSGQMSAQLRAVNPQSCELAIDPAPPSITVAKSRFRSLTGGQNVKSPVKQ